MGRQPSTHQKERPEPVLPHVPGAATINTLGLPLLPPEPQDNTLLLSNQHSLRYFSAATPEDQYKCDVCRAKGSLHLAWAPTSQPQTSGIAAKIGLCKDMVPPPGPELPSFLMKADRR